MVDSRLLATRVVFAIVKFNCVVFIVNSASWHVLTEYEIRYEIVDLSDQIFDTPSFPGKAINRITQPAIA